MLKPRMLNYPASYDMVSNVYQARQGIQCSVHPRVFSQTASFDVASN